MAAKKNGVKASGAQQAPEKSTALTVVETNYPALVGERLQEIGEILLENLGAKKASWTDLERIKVPSGDIPQFVVEDPVRGVSMLESFEAICVWFLDRRVWWPKSISDGGSSGFPDCISEDLVIGHGKNGKDDLDSRECMKCPQHRFGDVPVYPKDAPEASKYNWCSQKMMMFLLRREREKTIFPSVLVLPPTSIKRVNAYFTGLGGDGVRFYGMTTHFGLMQDQNPDGVTYAKVTVEPGEELSKEEMQRVAAYRAAIEPSFRSLQPTQD